MTGEQAAVLPQLQSEPSLSLPISPQLPQFVQSANCFIPSSVRLSPIDLKSKNPNSYPSESGVKPGSRKKRTKFSFIELTVHNTSEKRRVERLNSKIDELYSIISVGCLHASFPPVNGHRDQQEQDQHSDGVHQVPSTSPKSDRDSARASADCGSQGDQASWPSERDRRAAEDQLPRSLPAVASAHGDSQHRRPIRGRQQPVLQVPLSSAS